MSRKPPRITVSRSPTQERITAGGASSSGRSAGPSSTISPARPRSMGAIPIRGARRSAHTRRTVGRCIAVARATPFRIRRNGRPHGSSSSVPRPCTPGIGRKPRASSVSAPHLITRARTAARRRRPRRSRAAPSPRSSRGAAPPARPRRGGPGRQTAAPAVRRARSGRRLRPHGSRRAARGRASPRPPARTR